jgi:uncharacterized protein YjbI with pentapeptide repeats
MVRWLVRFAGSLALVVGMLAVPAVLSTTTPASADTVINGCTIVSSPTPTHFTNCPGVDFSGQDFGGTNLSYANLANANLTGAQLAQCFPGSPPTCYNTDFIDANLTDANLTGIITAQSMGSKCGPFPCTGGAIATFSGANLSGATMTDDTYGGVDFSGANLTDADLAGSTMDQANSFAGPVTIGATLTGANFTGTIAVPSNQSVTATSQAGAVATWSTPSGIAGATPGSCTPASGSTFPLFSSTVTCQVLDANGDVATGTFQVNVAPTTQYFTVVGIPSNGAVLAGDVYLDAPSGDAPGVTNVVFEVSGGPSIISDQVIATARPTIYGWIGQWNTTSVPNGTYTLQSVATDAAANTDTSEPISITVNNQPPATAVLIPSDGASVSGAKALLDASASSAVGIASVTFEVSGNGLTNQVVAPGTPTLYGYLAQWNTTAVPNGTYTLQSVATDTVAESMTSAPVSVTVDNPPPTTAVLIPSNGATQSGTAALLDASASANVTGVTYELTGGTLTNQVIATGTPTLYGWLAQWNTTSVPNGTYDLNTVASYAGGVSGTSAPISVTVTPLGLAALDANIAGSLSGGVNISATNSNSNAAGAAGTETLQTNVSLQSASVVSCSSGPFNLCELGTVSGTFTITTSVGTLSGTASGDLGGPLVSESPPQAVISAGGYTLTVTAATGALTSTIGGTLNVSCQFPPGSNDFTGTVTG